MIPTWWVDGKSLNACREELGYSERALGTTLPRQKNHAHTHLRAQSQAPRAPQRATSKRRTNQTGQVALGRGTESVLVDCRSHCWREIGRQIRPSAAAFQCDLPWALTRRGGRLELCSELNVMGTLTRPEGGGQLSRTALGQARKLSVWPNWTQCHGRSQD